MFGRALELLSLESVGPHSVLCGSTGRSELRRAGEGRGGGEETAHCTQLIHDDTRVCLFWMVLSLVVVLTHYWFVILKKVCQDIV